MKMKKETVVLAAIASVLLITVCLTSSAIAQISASECRTDNAVCREIGGNFREMLDPNTWTYDGSSYMANLKAMHDAINEKRGYVDNHALCPLRISGETTGYQTVIGNGTERPLTGVCPFCGKK